MFIAFDGMDGTGKSTQVGLLTELLRDKGKKVKKIDFGSAPFFFEYINKINKKEMDVPSEIRELIYYFEGLYVNLNYIQTMDRNEVVVIDRYYLSYFAYGLENGLTDDKISFFTKNLIEPDVYFFLDSDVETTCQRILSYRKFDLPELGYSFNEKQKSEIAVRKRFVDFQNKIRRNYLSHIKPNHVVIDGTKSIEYVNSRIWNVVKEMV